MSTVEARNKITYFKLRSGFTYNIMSKTNQFVYSFKKDVPVAVSVFVDIENFRHKPDTFLECNQYGVVLGSQQIGEKMPLSFRKYSKQEEKFDDTIVQQPVKVSETKFGDNTITVETIDIDEEVVISNKVNPIQPQLPPINNEPGRPKLSVKKLPTGVLNKTPEPVEAEVPTGELFP